MINGINETAYLQQISTQLTGKEAVQKKETQKSADQAADKAVDKTADNKTEKTTVTGTATFGNARLSQGGLAYYNMLKAKFSSMNFVLVASDSKQQAEAVKGSFASAGAMTVLIDTDKIEKMASDEQYRKKIEATISSAASGLTGLSKKISASYTFAGSSAGAVTAFGMTVKDGGNAMFFAVLKKANTAQKEHNAKVAKERKEEKEAEKDKRQEQISEAARDKADKAAETQGNTGKADAETDTVTVTAGSIEELIRKIQEYQYHALSDSIMTEKEKAVGASIDCKA